MKKYFYIITFIVGFNFGTFAQNRVSIISDVPAKLIKFYPNPAVNVINFEFQKGFDKFFSFNIYNFIGKKVLSIRTSTPKINIPLTDFYRGVYIFQLLDRSGKIIESGKFQVIR